MKNQTERPIGFLVASKHPKDYVVFDKRSKKPIYCTDDDTTNGAVLEILDHITISKIQEQIKFIPPNPIALQLEIMNNCIQKMKQMSLETTFKANSTRNKTEQVYENTKVIYDYISLTQQAIIFGYTALETFTNLSIPEDYQYKKKNHKGIVEIYDKESIEKWVNLQEKASEILVDIYQTSPVKKQKFWGTFVEFEKYRHEIIHQKSIDHSEFYRKYFKKEIFKYLDVVQVFICFFHNEAKTNGIGNILWPWLDQTPNEIPIKNNASEFIAQFKVIGNLYEDYPTTK